MVSVGLYFFAGVTLAAAALVALVSHLLAARADRAFRAALSPRGIEIVSSTFAQSLQLRSSDGVVVRRLVPLTLGSATAATAPELQRCSVAELAVPAADLVICRLRSAQAVFGPFLPPRILTGDPGFDAELGVFEPAPQAAEYRGSAPPATLPWAKPDVLAALHASGFVALQIAAGTMRLATAEKLGRPPREPLGHHLDLVALARRVRAAIASPSAPRPPFSATTVVGLGVRVESVGLLAALVVLTLLWLTPGTFGLGFLACPDSGVYHHIVRPPQDVCRLADGRVHATNLGTLTAVVGSSMAAVVAVVDAIGLARRGRYLARILRALPSSV